MEKIKGDVAHLVAAALVQAEMAIVGGYYAAGKSGGPNAPSSEQRVLDSYAFFLKHVTSGDQHA